MFKYVKYNEDNGLCTEVAFGTNTEYYKTHGFVSKDVEQSEIDNHWYLKDKCPHYTDEEKEAQKEKKGSEEKEQELQKAIEELGKEMTKAVLSGNDEWIEELKEEYSKLMNEEAEAENE